MRRGPIRPCDGAGVPGHLDPAPVVEDRTVVVRGAAAIPVAASGDRAAGCAGRGAGSHRRHGGRRDRCHDGVGTSGRLTETSRIDEPCAGGHGLPNGGSVRRSYTVDGGPANTRRNGWIERWSPSLTFAQAIEQSAAGSVTLSFTVAEWSPRSRALDQPTPSARALDQSAPAAAPFDHAATAPAPDPFAPGPDSFSRARPVVGSRPAVANAPPVGAVRPSPTTARPRGDRRSRTGLPAPRCGRPWRSRSRDRARRAGTDAAERMR